jgi:predicted esterase
MQEQQHKVKISKTARYYTWGNISTAKRIWFIFHGYGQLAKYFIRNFNKLSPEENFVVAPEGFYRFYIEGFSGRVGATWMTKDDRLDDIDDYVHFINAVYHDAIKSNRRKKQELVVLGFSQGVATASRWIAYGSPTPEVAVFWGGSFPPDLKPAPAKKNFGQLRTYCCVGNKDPYITEAQIDKTKAQLAALEIKSKWMQYDGGHKIPSEELDRFVETYLEK